MLKQDEIISSKWWEEGTQWGTYFWKPNKKDIVSDWISEVAVRWKHSQSAHLPSVEKRALPCNLFFWREVSRAEIFLCYDLCFAIIYQMLSGLLGSQRPQQAGYEATCDKLEQRKLAEPPFPPGTYTVLQLFLPHCVLLMHTTIRHQKAKSLCSTRSKVPKIHTHAHTQTHLNSQFSWDIQYLWYDEWSTHCIPRQCHMLMDTHTRTHTLCLIAGQWGKVSRDLITHRNEEEYEV